MCDRVLGQNAAVYNSSREGDTPPHTMPPSLVVIILVAAMTIAAVGEINVL